MYTHFTKHHFCLEDANGIGWLLFQIFLKNHFIVSVFLLWIHMKIFWTQYRDTLSLSRLWLSNKYFLDGFVVKIKLPPAMPAWQHLLWMLSWILASDSAPWGRIGKATEDGPRIVGPCHLYATWVKTSEAPSSWVLLSWTWTIATQLKSESQDERSFLFVFL